MLLLCMSMPLILCFWMQDADFASSAVKLAARELTEVASPGAVDPVQLQRAKQSTKSAILMNLESRMVASEDIGRQILMYNKRSIERNTYHLSSMIKIFNNLL
ncbi:hypothetical protein H0E87_018427 [Populus deltoides]|uniref:Uncharacterized protein n=1 Tax=Populus deltoides TaxID=3696 RepID=A0A8T2XRD2_POPDE|nr:hypothetical protein H0E87_018427 [Populus deltoides]KAH8495234.1 hypothetical protein H0E87_018427 [Populus deltoides]